MKIASSLFYSGPVGMESLLTNSEVDINALEREIEQAIYQDDIAHG